jgi:uncharacterized membrane protein
MKNWIQRDWLLLLVLAAPLVFIALEWGRIPERMPIHFDASFRPNGWGKKPWAPLLLPCASIFVVILTRLLFHFDPKMAKCDADTRLQVRKVTDHLLLAMAIFFSALSFTLVWAAWGKISPTIVTMNYGMPLLFLVVGNLLGKLRPNYTFGIRLPWTLESPVVWVKAHRFGGRLLVLVCVVLLAAAVLRVPEDTYTWVLLGSLLGWALVVTIYSFILSRKENQSAHPLTGSPS